MKYILSTFFLIVLLGQYAFCQSTFGLKAGLNLANQAKTFTTTENPNSQSQDTKPLLAYQAGVFYKLKIRGLWSFLAQANFSLTGSRTQYLTEDQILNPDGKTHYYNDKIGYVEVPLTVQYNFNKVYIGIGPSIAVKVFSKITNFENTSYKTSYYKTFDVAANLLAGYEFSKKWDMNVRYYYGLLNIHENNNYLKFPSIRRSIKRIVILYCKTKLNLYAPDR